MALHLRLASVIDCHCFLPTVFYPFASLLFILQPWVVIVLFLIWCTKSMMIQNVICLINVIHEIVRELEILISCCDEAEDTHVLRVSEQNRFIFTLYAALHHPIIWTLVPSGNAASGHLLLCSPKHMTINTRSKNRTSYFGCSCILHCLTPLLWWTYFWY